MNYSHHYDQLIENARNRVLELEYKERHHVLPKCAGGQDNIANIVDLTPEEHYVAHQLLYKIYLSKNTGIAIKLLYALNLMSGDSNIHRRNKYYGWIRRRINESRKGFKHSDETRAKISRKVKKYFAENGHHNKGKANTSEQKRKISETLIGRTHTWGDKIGNSLRGKPKSKEHRKKFQGKNNPSYKLVPENIKRQISNDFVSGFHIKELCKIHEYSEGKIQSILTEIGIDYSIRQCPHCSKSGQAGNMLRWHFDNCKTLNINVYRSLFTNEIK